MISDNDRSYHQATTNTTDYYNLSSINERPNRYRHQKLSIMTFILPLVMLLIAVSIYLISKNTKETTETRSKAAVDSLKLTLSEPTNISNNHNKDNMVINDTFDISVIVTNPGTFSISAVQDTITFSKEKFELLGHVAGDYFVNVSPTPPATNTTNLFWPTDTGSITTANQNGTMTTASGASCTTAEPWTCYPQTGSITSGLGILVKYHFKVKTSGTGTITLTDAQAADLTSCDPSSPTTLSSCSVNIGSIGSPSQINISVADNTVQPDLSITSITIEPFNVALNEYNIKTVIKNNGPVPVPGILFNNKWYLDPNGNPTASTTDIENNGYGLGLAASGNSGDSITYEFHHILPVGSHTIYAWADVNNTIAESNETNNLANSQYTVTASTPTVTPTTPSGNGSIKLLFKFQGVNSQKQDATASVSLKQNGTVVNTTIVTGTSDNSGVYTATLNANPGIYDVYVKGFAHLARKFPTPVEVTADNTIQVDLTNKILMCGDISGNAVSSGPDGKINPVDLGPILSILMQDLINPTSKFPNLKVVDFNLDNFININDLNCIINHMRLQDFLTDEN